MTDIGTTRDEDFEDGEAIAVNKEAFEDVPLVHAGALSSADVSGDTGRRGLRLACSVSPWGSCDILTCPRSAGLITGCRWVRRSC